MSTPDLNTSAPPSDTAQRLAAALGETDLKPIQQIDRILQVLGEPQVLPLVDQAKAIQAEGGELLADGSRARTLGGIFFRLVRVQTTQEQQVQIWGPKLVANRAREAGRADG